MASHRNQKQCGLMKRLNKFQKLGAPRNPRSHIQELKELSKQVQKSKIAVENITSYGVAERGCEEKLDDIQNQLQNCITNINIETKRNALLTQLNKMLKGEMYKYQNTEKKKEEAESIHLEKTMKKIQYQIDQISHKHNQEIAKIHQLKELANSRRSQRVVYSNLFKKLEKQIKHYEQMYKQQLVKSIGLQTKQIRLSYQKQEPIDSYNQLKQINPTFKALEEALNEQQSDQFHIFHKDNNRNGKSNKNEEHKSNKNLKGSSVNWDLRRQRSGQSYKKIQEYQNQIEKIKIYTECSTVEEILEHYSRLQEKNKEISEYIGREQNQINQYILQADRIKQKTNQINFNRYYEAAEQQLQKSRISEENQQGSESLKYQNLKTISCIHQVFGITDGDNPQLFQENLECLDNILSEFTSKTSLQPPQLQQKNTARRQDTNTSQSCVNMILDKMDRFANCQRILDRKYFQQEYYRQLSKKKSGVSLATRNKRLF